MSLQVDFNILNQKGTPAFFADAFANRPAAGFAGRIFVDTNNPSTGMYRDTGSAWIQIAGGGAAASNLQDVTDIGNTTTNNIELTYPDEGTNSLNFRNVNNIVGVNKATLEIDTNEYLQLRYNIYGAFATTLGLQFSGDQRLQTYKGGLGVGIYFDFDQYYYCLGDFSGSINGTNIKVDDYNNYITTQIGLSDFGLSVDVNSANLGDFANSKNNTWISINDTLQRMEVSGNLVTSSAGSNTTQHLSIYVGGVHYKIQLKNP